LIKRGSFVRVKMEQQAQQFGTVRNVATFLNPGFDIDSLMNQFGSICVGMEQMCAFNHSNQIKGFIRLELIAKKRFKNKQTKKKKPSPPTRTQKESHLTPKCLSQSHMSIDRLQGTYNTRTVMWDKIFKQIEGRLEVCTPVPIPAVIPSARCSSSASLISRENPKSATFTTRSPVLQDKFE